MGFKPRKDVLISFSMSSAEASVLRRFLDHNLDVYRSHVPATPEDGKNVENILSVMDRLRSVL